MSDYIKFINQEQPTNNCAKYDAGVVVKIGNNYGIGYPQKGAEDTFSIGQPVYDDDNNLMGYLGIILFESLNYSTDRNMRIPVETWGIILPTKHCDLGKHVHTYWQIKENSNEECI